VAGQPIVETPRDAVEAFASMRLDHLVLGDRLVSRPS
jgi:carbamoyltransferase